MQVNEYLKKSPKKVHDLLKEGLFNWEAQIKISGTDPKKATIRMDPFSARMNGEIQVHLLPSTSLASTVFLGVIPLSHLAQGKRKTRIRLTTITAGIESNRLAEALAAMLIQETKNAATPPTISVQKTITDDKGPCFLLELILFNLEGAPFSIKKEVKDKETLIRWGIIDGELSE